jgi:hypothetical protein
MANPLTRTNGVIFNSLGAGDLRRLRFAGSAAPNQTFRGNFIECHFDKFAITAVDFSRCDWKDCWVRDTRFVDCDLGHASFITNSFVRCVFVRCRFPDTGISDCEFASCEFIDCDLKHIVVKASRFAETSFERCATSNRVIESSLLVRTRWRQMQIETGLITSNFGLKATDLQDVEILRVAKSRRRTRVGADALARWLPDATPLEAFRVAYFRTGSVDGDPDVLEAAIDPRNWDRDAPIRASLGTLVSSLSQFFLEEYDSNAMAFYPLLRFHTNNFALLDLISGRKELTDLYQTVAGVHMNLTREVDAFLFQVQTISDHVDVRKPMHLAAEGPCHLGYFSSLFRDLKFSGVRVVEVRPRNSPVDLLVTLADESWLIALVALVLACRTKIEISRIGPPATSKQPTTKRQQKRPSGPRTNQPLAKFGTGFSIAKPSQFEINFQTMLPRSLLLQLHLTVSVRLFKRVRETLLVLLSQKQPPAQRALPKGSRRKQ